MASYIHADGLVGTASLKNVHLNENQQHVRETAK